MTKALTIKKAENESLSILHVLKCLFMEGTEIDSLEDIKKFYEVYMEEGVCTIKVDTNALNIFERHFDDKDITYHVMEYYEN